MAEELNEQELGELESFLAKGGELTLTGLDGFATGLAVAPAPIAQEAWCGVLAEALERDTLPEEMVTLVARHVDHLRAALKSAEFAPRISEDLADAVEWSAGFLGATDLFAELLDADSEEDEVLDLMLPIVLLGTDEGLEALEESGGELADALVASIGFSVSQLARLLKERRS